MNLFMQLAKLSEQVQYKLQYKIIYQIGKWRGWFLFYSIHTWNNDKEKSLVFVVAVQQMKSVRISF